MQADLHPVELGEDVVGQVERAVGEDVALASAQDAERSECLVGGRDLLGLTAQVVRIEARHDADRSRVVADRQILVPALERSFCHLEHRRLAVRCGRVNVQVAADVVDSEQILGRIGGVELPQLRRAVRAAECGVQLLLGGRSRQLAEARHVLGRAGRAHELGAEAIGRGGDDLDRDALSGHADDPSFLLL